VSQRSPLQAFTVVMAVVVVCASLVSAAVVLLRPIQSDNRLLQQAQVVLQLTGAAPVNESVANQILLQRFQALDARVIDLDTGRFDPDMDPYALDVTETAADPELSTAIPAGEDWAQLGRRGRYSVMFLLWEGDRLDRIVLPIHGTGMWSTIRGYVMLEADLNTIAGATFYEQAETPGVGDRITRKDWLEKWRGRKIYDEPGTVQFMVSSGRVAPGSASELHNVDVLTGATVTADAVTHMMRFWFGPWGYLPVLQWLREQPPQPPRQDRAAP